LFRQYTIVYSNPNFIIESKDLILEQIKMNIFFIPSNLTLLWGEGAGGLFDFNATMPLMALQFILLTIVLTFTFYKPINGIIEERETLISSNLAQASDKLVKADELYKEYELQLKTAKTEAQSIVAESEKEAKEIVASEINQARKDAANLIARTNRELDTQKSMALEKLETQIEELSQQITEKLLGKESVL
jgi:F-type H+-transporting ATPase subunit b